MTTDAVYRLCMRCVLQSPHDVTAACRNNQQSHFTSQLSKEDAK